MRKLLVVVLLLATTFTAAFAEDAFEKQVKIGRDKSGMTWWLIDYGFTSSNPYAIARKYYTSEAGREEAIDILTSRYSVKQKKAESLYFTEYRYEYTSDYERVAEVYRRYYDQKGRLICGLEFDGSTSAQKKTYTKVVKNSIQSKGLAYATGKLKKK